MLSCVFHSSLAGESGARAHFAARACTTLVGSLLFPGQVFEGKDLETMKDVAIKLVRKVRPAPPFTSCDRQGQHAQQAGSAPTPLQGAVFEEGAILDYKGFGGKFEELVGESRIHGGCQQHVPDRALHIPPSLHKPCPYTMTLLLPEPPLRGRLPPQRAVPGTNPPRCSHRPGKKSVWTRHPPRSGGFLGSS